MTDFHDVRFPLHLAFGTRGGPSRPTEVLQFANGTEARNARGRHSRRRYNAVAGLKSREQVIELLEFYEARFGPLYGFRFHDPLDYEADNEIAIGNGMRKEFQLTKHYGTSPHTYSRPITKPVGGSVRVFVDGVESAVSIEYLRGVISFSTAPDEGAIISAQFEFDVSVRFGSDTLDIVLDDFGATQIEDIPLIEILDVTETDHG